MTHAPNECPFISVVRDNPSMSQTPPHCAECDDTGSDSPASPSPAGRFDVLNPIAQLQDLFRRLDANPDDQRPLMDQVNEYTGWLHDEVSELRTALRRAQGRTRTVAELADCLNLVVILSVRLGISAEELLQMCEFKFERRAQRYPRRKQP